ncbi:hypothetical protein R1sor_003482 [Riccia sorocarpa]|uniref:UV-stimulated scaffold protein A C-terminal domain-containing protein n=1 Tax=Riccia sorocarpa TaxID=122646 RepID=A0ABD3H547_9MARC
MGRRQFGNGGADGGLAGGGTGGSGKVRKKNDENELGGEYDDRNRLADLVDSATNSPLLTLDDRSLAAFKALVRRSETNVHAAFELLYDKLKKNNSQVRYLSLLLMDELFTRSKLFRSLLVPVFENFLLLSVGFRSDYPLPPPEERAALLRKKAIEIVEKWNDMYGQHYKPLRLAYEYLKKTLRFEFPNARETATLAQQQRKERERRTQELLKKKFTSLKSEYPELRAEIHSTLEQINECVAILAEKKNGGDDQQEQFGFDSDEDEFEEYGARNLRSARGEVEEQETLAYETGENAALFDTLRDLYRLLTSRHLVSAQEWLSTLMRVDPEEERQARDTLLRDVIDLRNKVVKAREVCEGAGIERTEGASKSAADGDAEEIIWEEGDVLISNSAISELIEASGAAEPTEVKPVSEPTAEANTMELEKGKQAVINKADETEEDNSLKAQLLKQAPLLKWGQFLERWGSDRAIPANNRGLEFENHWGKVDYDVTIPAEKLAESSLNLRAVYYSAEKTEIPPCLAPLRNGGLCQRRDLKRCPFHGPIIPRDSTGKPLELEKPAKLPEVSKSSENTDELTSTLPSEPKHEELVQQAIANVRQKDEEFRKKVLEDKKSVRRERAKRAREHNEACLRAAAIGTTSEGLAEAFGQDVMAAESQPKKRRGGLAALLRKKPTVKDRLSRRLLSGRVRDATATQLARDEQAAYRESFPNQW